MCDQIEATVARAALGGEPEARVFMDFYIEKLTPVRFALDPFPFINEGGFMGKDGKQLFRVPVLRNVTRTAPYFHNGSVEKIEEVVRIMSKYQVGQEFTKQQIDDVVAFLKTIEGDIVDYSSDVNVAH